MEGTDLDPARLRRKEGGDCDDWKGRGEGGREGGNFIKGAPPLQNTTWKRIDVVNN